MVLVIWDRFLVVCWFMNFRVVSCIVVWWIIFWVLVLCMVVIFYFLSRCCCGSVGWLLLVGVFLGFFVWGMIFVYECGDFVMYMILLVVIIVGVEIVVCEVYCICIG